MSAVYRKRYKNDKKAKWRVLNFSDATRQRKAGLFMQVKIKMLREGAKIPVRGSEYAAGYDLFACIDEPSGKITIAPHQTVKIGTGVAMAIPNGWFGAVFARSGLASKQGLRPANCVGVADSDYRGEYFIALHNDGETAQTVRNGDRIAQLVVMPFAPVEFEQTEELDETERGAGGFGSTGK